MEVFRMGVIDYILIIIVTITITSFCTIGFLFLRRLWKYLGRR